MTLDYIATTLKSVAKESDWSLVKSYRTKGSIYIYLKHVLNKEVVLRVSDHSQRLPQREGEHLLNVRNKHDLRNTINFLLKASPSQL
jgi:hypothetical protein